MHLSLAYYIHIRAKYNVRQSADLHACVFMSNPTVKGTALNSVRKHYKYLVQMIWHKYRVIQIFWQYRRKPENSPNRQLSPELVSHTLLHSTSVILRSHRSRSNETLILTLFFRIFGASTSLGWLSIVPSLDPRRYQEAASYILWDPRLLRSWFGLFTWSVKLWCATVDL
jgi:hypothetical protein